jgi:transcriptional regulator with XRE-family HTH domain
MSLPEDIVAAYNRSGLTQDDLARKVGVARQTVGLWLRGEVAPRGHNLYLLRQALGLEAEADAGALAVAHYRILRGQLARTNDTETVDASLVRGADAGALGTLLVPSGWDNMLLYVRPGDRLLLDLYDPPQDLRTILSEGRFADGVYLVSFSGSIQIRRLQELPGRTVAVLNDNSAYRDVELDLDAGDDLVLHARVLAAEGPA